MEKKTIVLVVDGGWAARYLIYSDIFLTLKQNDDIRIVILARKGSLLNFLKENHNGKNIFFHELNFEGLKKYSEKLFPSLSQRIMAFVLNDRYDISTIIFQEQYLYQQICDEGSIFKKIYFWLSVYIPVRILRKSSIGRKLFRFFVTSFQNVDLHNELYKTYKPDLFINTSLGFRLDSFLMREAKKNKSKIISIIMNWDYTTTKGMCGCSPDHTIVWNEGMKQETIIHHDIPERDIFIGGVPHYDPYFREQTFYSKEIFLNKYKLDQKKKILFFGTMSPTQFPWNPDIVELIAEINARNGFIYPCQLIVRLHPIYYNYRRKSAFLRDKDRFDNLKKKYPDTVFFNIPKFINDEEELENLHPDDMKELINIIKNSSIMLCFFSTLILEASILDTPNISLCLEGKSDFLGKDMIVLKETHLQNVINSGGVKIIYNEKELIDGINYYLEDPTRDAEGRKKIRETYCNVNTGNAGATIANFIKEKLNEQ